MTTERLKAIAQRLRSDNINERHVAVRKIESITGMTMNAVIRTGAPRVTHGTAVGWILDHAAMKTGDDLILSVGAELASLQIDWEDVVQAATNPSAKQKGADFGAAFEGIFKDFFGGMAQGQTNKPAQPATQPSGEPPVIRVTRANLPIQATGVPQIVRHGKSKIGQAYAVVKFREFISFGGQRMKPMAEFIAFGDAWVEKIIAAEAAESDITFGFANVEAIGKLPQIKEVL